MISGQKQFDLARLFHDQNRILVMGVVNTTPDSFSDGGRFFGPDAAIDHARQLIADGADILDIGGESSRPGSEPVSAEEELRRIMPVISELAEFSPIPISIDTYKARVAAQALDAGAAIVNDITGLRGDPPMAATVATFKAGLILMHMRGLPKTMQKDTEYTDLMGDISSFLKESVAIAESSGVDPQKIIIDPGVGFGKDIDGNLEIIRSISRLTELGKPVLIGASRKAFIGKITGADVSDRLAGSVAAAVAAVLNGASIVRVHDVRATRQAVDLAIKLRKA